MVGISLGENLKHFFTVLVLCAACSAQANMRAPFSVVQASSSALHATVPVAGLLVHGEVLSMDCTLKACEVVATYRIQSAVEQDVKLVFVLPNNVAVQAQVNETQVDVAVARVEQPSEMEQWALKMDARTRYPALEILHQATFGGYLQQGANTIEVRYTQPLSMHERDLGYFRNGRMVSTLVYEVWPLKQWTLAPDFELALRVRFEPVVPPGFWAKLGTRAQALQCSTAHKPADPEAARYGMHERKVLESAWQNESAVRFHAANLPDRLICEMGDEDLLK
jgi:hypothetical protein